MQRREAALRESLYSTLVLPNSPLDHGFACRAIRWLTNLEATIDAGFEEM